MELCHAVLNTLPPGPELDHWVLNNGVRCVQAAMPDSQLTCLDLWCRAGSCSEHAEEQGMAHFLEHMVFKGSQHLPAGAFDREIEALGGSSNAATGFDDVHFHVLIPAEQASRALDLLLELVLNPTIDAADFEMERDVVLEEIAQYADQPDERVLQELLTRSCPMHAYGRPILGHKDQLLRMTPAAMRKFHARRYRGGNCCLAIAGAASEQWHQVIGNSALNDLEQFTPPLSSEEPPRVVSGRHDCRVERLESARILMLWPMAAAVDQHRLMGADLVTTLLGEGRRSRLVAHLREELRIADTVEMDLTVLEQGSLVTLEISCREEDLEAVEHAVTEQMHQLLDQAAQDWELERARRLVRSGMLFSLESAGQVAGIAASQTLWNRDQALLDPLRHLEHWSAEDLREDILPQLQPSRAFTLVARPGGTN